MFICGENRDFGKTLRNMAHKFFVAFIPIFVAIDPIGLVALFMGLAGNASREQRQREGFIGILTALCVSVGFVFLGKIIFTALGITVADFQVAGGLILLGLAGRESYSIAGVENGDAREVTVRADGKEFRARVRLDTPREREYLRHGGILQYVLRRLLSS